MKRRKAFRILLWSTLFFVLLLNGIAFMHAYKLTHFTTKGVKRTEKNISLPQKLGVLFTGINNPKPVNKQQPSHPYQTIILQSNKQLHCWHVQAANPKGTIILFHGYGSEKSGMLDKSDEFLKSGYNTLLVDFMGAGNSEGTQTTIGYKEAEEVKTCFDYLQQTGERNIHLFGTSMGAVAILKAIDDYKITPASIIIECPFGTLYQTVCARFKMVGVPEVPMAALLVFWGGVQNGFWGFSHNPEVYAKSVTCPALVLYGERDDRVSQAEIDAIYDNLQGKKRLITFPLAGHENYLVKYKQNWSSAIQSFLNDIP